MNNEVIKVTVCERVNTEDVERGKTVPVMAFWKASVTVTYISSKS